MTDIARWQPARLPRPRPGATGAGEPPRQFVRFAFYALDPAWLRLDAATRQADALELAAVIAGHGDRLLVHSYTTLGACADADFLLWQVARRLDDFEALAVAMRRARLAAWLRTPYSYLATIDTPPRRRDAPGDAPAGGGRYLLVCPLARTAAWDALPDEERGEVTRELVRFGSETPGSDWDMTYSVGLDAHDAVLAFEADRAEALPDIVAALRKTRSSRYARRDTPVFTATRQDPATLLAHIGGV